MLAVMIHGLLFIDSTSSDSKIISNNQGHEFDNPNPVLDFSVQLKVKF